MACIHVVSNHDVGLGYRYDFDGFGNRLPRTGYCSSLPGNCRIWSFPGKNIFSKDQLCWVLTYSRVLTITSLYGTAAANVLSEPPSFSRLLLLLELSEDCSLEVSTRWPVLEVNQDGLGSLSWKDSSLLLWLSLPSGLCPTTQRLPPSSARRRLPKLHSVLPTITMILPTTMPPSSCSMLSRTGRSGFNLCEYLKLFFVAVTNNNLVPILEFSLRYTPSLSSYHPLSELWVSPLLLRNFSRWYV